MSRIEITLASGATVMADVTEFTIQRSPISGEMMGIQWDKPGNRKLLHARVESIDAIVFVDDSDDEERDR